MDFSKINELKPYHLNCNIFDVYSYDGLSMQELLCQFFTKINECIKISNETIDLVEWLVNEGLKQEVAKKLTQWLEDGTLADIINITIFNDLNNKIKEIYVTNLNEFKESILKSNVIINLKPQEYILDSLLDISSVENVSINGNGSVIKTNNDMFMRICNNSKNITINNIIFDGSLVTKELNNHHLWLRDCENINISNCEFKNLKYGERVGSSKEGINGNDGIYLRSMTHDSPKYANKNISIRDCKFTHISRNAISIIQGENILIDNCYFASRRAGVDIEPNSVNEFTRNVTVQNCIADGSLNYHCYNIDGSCDSETIQHYGFEVSGNKHSSLYPGYGITQVVFKNNKVIGNKSNQLNAGIKMSWLEEGRIEGNTLINCNINLSEFVDNGAISLYRFDKGYILNNTIENYGESKGIRTYSGNYLKCENNIIRNGEGYGLHIGAIDINNYKISKCVFEDCGNLTNSVIYGNRLNIDSCTFTANKQINDFVFLDNNNARDSRCYINNSTFNGNDLVNYGVRTTSGSVKSSIISNSKFYNITHSVTSLSSRDTQTDRVYEFTNNIIENSGKISFGYYADICNVTNNLVLNSGNGTCVFDIDKTGSLIFSMNNIQTNITNKYGLVITQGDMARSPKIVTNNIFKNCTTPIYGINEIDIENNNIKS